MSNPAFPNVNFDVGSAMSVQNRVDENGSVATYVIFKPGILNNMQMKKSHNGGSDELVFKFMNVESIVALTASLISAYGSKTVTGSF